MQNQLKAAMDAVAKELNVNELPKAPSIEALLDTRGRTHGDYRDHARVTQRLKGVVIDELLARQRRGQEPLSHEAMESIDMILHKIGRVIAGQADFADHWDDIAGYAKLVVRK